MPTTFILCMKAKENKKEKKGNKEMRKLTCMAYAIGLMIAGISLQSCSDDDTYVAWPNPWAANALVTVQPEGNGKPLTLKLDDKTTLTPTNLTASPFGNKVVRAICNLTFEENPADKYNQKARVNWIDSIRTKNMAVCLVGENENIKAYGNDPVEIVNDWLTVAEDGYLTLRFRTRWGDKEPHLVNLVADNKTNPYEVTFHHKGNVKGAVADGIVAFKLDQLPDTKGQTVDVKLKWTSFSGPKSITFKYNTNHATNANTQAFEGISIKHQVK